jgi:hypothetical protein
MREVLALAAFGLLINASFFMTFFWGRIAIRRLRYLQFKGVTGDKYAVLASCLTTSSIGTVIYFTTRAWRGVMYGEIPAAQPYISSYFLLLGLFIIGFSKAGFVWAVNCDMRSKTWRAFLALSGAWVLLAVLFDVVF